MLGIKLQLSHFCWFDRGEYNRHILTEWKGISSSVVTKMLLRRRNSFIHLFVYPSIHPFAGRPLYSILSLNHSLMLLWWKAKKDHTRSGYDEEEEDGGGSALKWMVVICSWSLKARKMVTRRHSIPSQWTNDMISTRLAGWLNCHRWSIILIREIIVIPDGYR